MEDEDLIIGQFEAENDLIWTRDFAYNWRHDLIKNKNKKAELPEDIGGLFDGIPF